MSLPSFLQEELQKLDDIFGMGFIIDEEYQERRRQLFENAGIPDPKQNSTGVNSQSTDFNTLANDNGFTTSNDYDYNSHNTHDIHYDTYDTSPVVYDYGNQTTNQVLDYNYTDPSIQTEQPDNYYSNQTYTSSNNNTHDQYPSQSYPQQPAPSHQNHQNSSSNDSTAESRHQNFYANFLSQKNAVVVYRKQIYGLEQTLPLTNCTASEIAEALGIPKTNYDFVLINLKTHKEIPFNAFRTDKIPPGSYFLEERPTLVHRSGTAFYIRGNRDVARPSFNPLEAFRGVPANNYSNNYNSYGGYSSSGLVEINGESLPKLDEATKKAVVLGCLAGREGISSLNKYIEFCRDQHYFDVKLDRQPQNPDEVALLLHSNGDAKQKGELVEETRGKEYSLNEQKFGYAPAHVLDELFQAGPDGAYKRKPKKQQVDNHTSSTRTKTPKKPFVIRIT